MAADVQIHEMTGAAAGVDKTGGTVRFKSADETAADTNNRLAIPASGETRSYTKQLRFYLNSAPAVDIINLRAYSDGANGFGTGVSVEYDVQGAFVANVQSDIGGADLFGKVSGDPIDLDAINTGPHTGTGYKGDFLRLQMVIADTASPGVLVAEDLTFSYDET